MVLPALQAVDAGVAGAAGIDRDALANREAGDARAERMQRARHLMAKHHRLLQADDAKAAMVVIMQVRAANAADADADENLARAGHGHRHGVNAQVLGGVNDGGAGGDLRHGVSC